MADISITGYIIITIFCGIVLAGIFRIYDKFFKKDKSKSIPNEKMLTIYQEVYALWEEGYNAALSLEREERKPHIAKFNEWYNANKLFVDKKLQKRLLTFGSNVLNYERYTNPDKQEEILEEMRKIGVMIKEKAEKYKK